MRAARVYAERLGWRVVPLHDVSAGRCSCGRDCGASAGKHPRLKEWEQIATNDLEVVDGWISRWPNANVGVATGAASGFFVFDVDPDHGGNETLAELIAQHGDFPETARAQTGSGGTHYLFKLPGFTIRNSAGKIGLGLDTRGDGGQIVVAPSVSAKGKYRWIKKPWEVEIAEAPAWLLERLSRAPEKKPNALGTSNEDRGFFPAATPEVLEAARLALAEHGPGAERVNGEGGGMHTVQAGAILMHDFALSEDEAWPLFVEWNETRTPPFPHEELRIRLRRGGKYGKADYGARRSMDVIETAKKLIGDWQTAGSNEQAMFPMIERARKLAQQSGDTAKRAVLLRELQGATGLGARDLDLPAPRAAHGDLEDGEIEVSPRVHEVADLSTEAMKTLVFQRGGVLCEIVKHKQTTIADLETPRIQDLMSKSAKFVRVDEKGKTVQAPPIAVAAILHARRTHVPIRTLEAVTTAPVFLADGSILQKRGYDAASRLYLDPSVSVDVASRPDHDDALAAVEMFRDLLCDFKFTTPSDFSSWLAALLSPLVKAATGNAPAPLFCMSAASPGAGKTLLTEVIARIVTGGDAEVRPYNPRDPGEWGKRLTAFIKAASPVSVFDNCNGPIGDEGLDRLITSSTWSDRILGASEAPPLPNVTTWLATGNNIEPTGDTVRRVLMVRIEVDTERPQERTDFKHPELKVHVIENRAELLSAALTILRAYHVAGRPPQKIPSWGSFTDWSSLVRSAVVWAGGADPFLTQRRAQAQLNQPDNEAHDFWLSVIEDSGGGLAGPIATLANQRDAVTVLNMREQVNAFTLRKFVGRFVDKPRNGRKIRKETDTRANQERFYVERIASK